MTIETKQLNVTLPFDNITELKRFCYLNGITLAGLFRHIIPRLMSENIPLNMGEIRRADYEHRAKGSRF